MISGVHKMDFQKSTAGFIQIELKYPITFLGSSEAQRLWLMTFNNINRERERLGGDCLV